ncbi:MAG: formylglycine-generating enzyme family protein [Campylobacteraceae bacterium]|jgi:formylglycine-generating enzyme required for sulfatase activity|nr:formylglycine-generating enzyme family protein [Campylobacteraceae bacterium]
MIKYYLFLIGLTLILVGCGNKDKELSKTYTNSIGMKFVLIDAGSFMMGSNENENEQPIREIMLDKSFYLGATEVTQEQWEKIMDSNPSKVKAATNPVDSVSWYDIKLFLAKLNMSENSTKYRLPTEVEWEYAAGAASNDTYSFGNDEKELKKYAWHYDKKDKIKNMQSNPVGQKIPNRWGLYDMYGNVWEWVESTYDKKFYAKNPKINFTINTGNTNILKGGSSYNSAEFLRSAARISKPSNYSDDNVGFRVAVTIED